MPNAIQYLVKNLTSSPITIRNSSLKLSASIEGHSQKQLLLTQEQVNYIKLILRGSGIIDKLSNAPIEKKEQEVKEKKEDTNEETNKESSNESSKEDEVNTQEEEEEEVQGEEVKKASSLDEKAFDAIKVIQKMESAEDIDEYISGDERTTVINAAEERKESLK